MLKKFSLKQGDEIIIRINKNQAPTTVIGFYCYGMSTDMGIMPFNAGRFYSCGYDPYGTPVYALKKSWHYWPAKICEFIRLKTPYKLSKIIFGF